LSFCEHDELARHVFRLFTRELSEHSDWRLPLKPFIDWLIQEFAQLGYCWPKAGPATEAINVANCIERIFSQAAGRGG
jgi:hypothetical protein